ncbi:MAG: hypothetical protein M3Q93_15195 [Gemmatimonadota bacterium]|nr:hypothetical protein [Gemmatimonadota bacterium]
MLEADHPGYASPTTGFIADDRLHRRRHALLRATAQLDAIRAGGRAAPPDSSA